jgi:hypothetical protein
MINHGKILLIILINTGIGNTDGEFDERAWNEYNGYANQTKNMLPQSRKETLEDAFLNRNLKSFSHSLLHRFRLKLNDAINSVAAFADSFD